MVSEDLLYAQLPYCLTDTHLEALGERYAGKVRDCYSRGGERIIVTSDRLSCFDTVVTAVPFKGEVLTELALYWFDLAAAIVPTHVVGHPDPNIIIGKEARVLPIEVVVRGFLTGSAWRDYESGRPVSGVELPKGLRKSHRFPAPILTPSTKAEKGSHDLPISESEIVSRGLVPAALWKQVRAASLELFALGQRVASERGLLLVDTKYEFGLYEDSLMLVDEIHTLDSSRYWIAAEYEERYEKGLDQIMLDKEPTRQWLLAQGYSGDGPIPHFSDEHRVAIAKHYISSYEQITAHSFTGTPGDPLPRIKKNLGRG